ncbi:MAG TPA: hypothetical protein VGM92_01420, partial [Candidatus Kapabacteria bacterium]
MFPYYESLTELLRKEQGFKSLELSFASIASIFKITAMLRTVSLFFTTILVTLFSALPSRAQWVQTNGPNGGSFYTFTSSGTNLYAATLDSVFRSTDHGLHWMDTRGTLPAPILITTLFATGTNIYLGTSDGRIFLSTDSGGSWKKIGSTTGPASSFAMIGTNLFVGTGDGIFISSDNGGTWTQSDSGIIGIDVVSLATIGTHLFAATPANGVFISTNNGTSWNSVTHGLYYEYLYVTSLFVNGTKIFVGSQDGVISSTNEGATWRLA